MLQSTPHDGAWSRGGGASAKLSGDTRSRRVSASPREGARSKGAGVPSATHLRRRRSKPRGPTADPGGGGEGAVEEGECGR